MFKVSSTNTLKYWWKKWNRRIPENINQIFKIDQWARETTLDKIKKSN